MTHTGKKPVAGLERPIPPARAMPIFASRSRMPGTIAARAVGSYVPGLTRKAFEKHGFSTVALITDWEKIAGRTLARCTEPLRLKWPRGAGLPATAGEDTVGRPGATLVLAVDPAAALQVEYGAAQLVERINSYFGYRAIAEIRLVQTPPRNIQSDTTASEVSRRRAERRAPVAGAVPADADPSLYAALERLHAAMTAGQDGRERATGLKIA
ncbi:MAG: DUF721 domain-containing protein [Hyphomicrobium sp.]